jgi:hypothetical protein
MMQRYPNSYFEMIPCEDEVRAGVQRLEPAATVVIKHDNRKGWLLEVRSSRALSVAEQRAGHTVFENVGVNGIIAEPVIPMVLPFVRPAPKISRSPG